MVAVDPFTGLSILLVFQVSIAAIGLNSGGDGVGKVLRHGRFSSEEGIHEQKVPCFRLPILDLLRGEDSREVLADGGEVVLHRRLAVSVRTEKRSEVELFVGLAPALERDQAEIEANLCGGGQSQVPARVAVVPVDLAVVEDLPGADIVAAEGPEDLHQISERFFLKLLVNLHDDRPASDADPGFVDLRQGSPDPSEAGIAGDGRRRIDEGLTVLLVGIPVHER